MAKEGPRNPITQCMLCHFVVPRAQKGAVLRLKNESEIELISGAEKVLHIDAPRLANRTLGTSKVKEIHRRGC